MAKTQTSTLNRSNIFLNIFTSIFNSAFFLITLALLFLCLEIIAPSVFSMVGGVFDGRNIASIAFVAIYANICFFILPAITAKWIFRENLQHLGLQFPKNKLKAISYIVISLFIVLPLMFFFSTQAQCRAYYFLGHMPLTKFIFLHMTFVPLYYFAEEFFFRGYLFLGLWKRIGWHSYWVTEILFILAHLWKPGMEILLSLPAGIVLSYITLKTRSVYPAMLVHYTMGVFLNIFVNYM